MADNIGKKRETTAQISITRGTVEYLAVIGFITCIREIIETWFPLADAYPFIYCPVCLHLAPYPCIYTLRIWSPHVISSLYTVETTITFILKLMTKTCQELKAILYPLNQPPQLFPCDLPPRNILSTRLIAMPPRRAHTKSRHGCERCKRRRIKCDEAGPPCGHCAARKADCHYATGGLFRHSEWSEQCQNSPISPTYQINKSATSYESGTNLPLASEALLSALPTVPRGRRRELQLMHVWSMKTCHSFSSNLSGVFQSFVVEQAFHHSFLMDSLLALTSLHIASGTASSNDNELNNHHGSLNLAIVSEYIGDALHYQNSAVPAFSSALENISPSNCDALFACSVIMMACAAVAPFIGRSRGNTRENLTSPFHFVKGIHSIIDKSRSWLAKGPCRFAIIIHSDDDWERSQQDNEVFHRLRKLCSHPNSAIRNTINRAITLLGNCFAKDETMAIPWIVVVGEDFVDLVQQEEPMALLLYMYWGALLSRLKEVWWAKLSGRGIVDDLAKELAGVNECAEAIQWATEEVGINKEELT